MIIHFNRLSSSLQVNMCLVEFVAMLNAATLKQTKSLSFFSEVKSELSKVVWPSREETIRLTGIVIVVSAVVGIFIGSLDYILTIVTGLIIK